MGGKTSTLAVALVAAWAASVARGGEKAEGFDGDPGWEGRNHRATTPDVRTIRQDFGFSRTNHAGKTAGEIGGFLTPSAEAAHYAKVIPQKTFRDKLVAAGTLAATGRQFHALIGYFNAATTGSWRTPNSIALRVYGRGDVFYAYLEYATSRWRAGGDSPTGFTIRDETTGKQKPYEFASSGKVHTWSLRYDPEGNRGAGSIVATIDDRTAVCHLDKNHKPDGATFNRFGLMNVQKHADSGGEIWLDDLVIDGDAEPFDSDPGWRGVGNRAEFTTADVRPRFDFGFSPTRFAGGKAAGELGGLVFRGDARSPRTLAYYADRLDSLRADRPLRASGLVSLRRGVSDSTTLLGFFRAEDATATEQDAKTTLPANFVGLAIEGPSREGFQVYPVYRLQGAGEDTSRGKPEPPHILPDGSAHRWSLDYAPPGPGREGKFSVSLDGVSTAIDLDFARGAPSARLDRFGIVTTRIDGNGQRIYFDDLTYTSSQQE